jgi:tRNA modification GTPase
VRISGPKALECVRPLFKTNEDGVSLDRHFPQAISGSLLLPFFTSPLPCDAFLWANARSYTGQPVVEIHTVGSPCMLDAVLKAVCVAGARLAEPGEFTMRAFLCGRIDLTQAEAVLGVIDADDSQALQTALAQLAGGLSHPLHQLREMLLDILTHLEAGFDFVDEEIAFITPVELRERLAEAQKQVAAIRRQMEARGEKPEAIRAVLVGCPNAGKSSLFNALVGDRAALVSDHPGTTRDYLTAEVDLDGVRCQLIDTAGLGSDVGESSQKSDSVSGQAESVTREQHRLADLRIVCIDAARPTDAQEWEELGKPMPLVVWTKCDSPMGVDCPKDVVPTSSRTGAGIDALRQELRRRVIGLGTHGDVVLGTAVRCADSLRLAEECLERAARVASDYQDELSAAEIRTALTELGKVVGTVYTEDVLDRIFSRFCIGK